MDHANKALDILEKEKIIGVDVEATGLDPYTAELLVVQIGTESVSYIFDVEVVDFNKFERVKKLLENNKILKLLQNAKFDYKMIKQQTAIELNNVYDTMLAELVLTAGINKSASLLALCRRYLDLDLDKEIRTTFSKLYPGQKLSKPQLEYSALDTLVLFPIFQKQWPKLKEEGLIDVAKLEFKVTSVVGNMELNGIYIDKNRWKKIIKVLKKKRKQISEEFQEMVRPYYKINQTDMFSSDGMADSLNINSQVQLMNLFNNKIGLDLESTSVNVLKKVNHPVVKKLMEYREYEKLVSAFGDKLLSLINPKTKRLHPDFHQMRTATGRFACSGPNLQQIPRNSEEAPFRKCFNPEPGYKLVVSDYSSAEMRIMADLSKDQKMIDAFKNGLDMHSFVASMMFGEKYTDDFKQKHPELRQAAKAIGFGLMYGMGPLGLATRLEISREKAEKYMDKYFKSFPKVKRYLDKASKEAIKRGYSTTPVGRKRWYTKPERTDPDYRRKIGSIGRRAKNHPIQGTNADAIKYAFVYLDKRIKKEGIDAKITHTVHDEIVFEVKEEEAEYFGKVLSEEMVRALELFVKEVPVVCDYFIGDVWEHWYYYSYFCTLLVRVLMYVRIKLWLCVTDVGKGLQ